MKKYTHVRPVVTLSPESNSTRQEVITDAIRYANDHKCVVSLLWGVDKLLVLPGMTVDDVKPNIKYE